MSKLQTHEQYVNMHHQKIEHDPINRPQHYTRGRIEPIDVIEDWQLGFHLGNCVKYIARAGHKGTYLEDLQKAQWYLNRSITKLQEEK